MNKLKLSVVIPYVNEWPQIVFTVRAIREELRGFCDHEIIVVDNYCPEVENQGVVPDRGHERYRFNRKTLPLYSSTKEERENANHEESHLKSMADKHPWLIYRRYDKKLSCWQSRNQGAFASTGNLLLFVDSHVIPSRGSIRYVYSIFFNHLLLNKDQRWDNYTVHLPLAYHILERQRLGYKMQFDYNLGLAHYAFTNFENIFPEDTDDDPVDRIVPADRLFYREVPCMSTCGMMMTRKLFVHKLRGYPRGLGIYGGGEHFLNYTMAVLGFKKFLSSYGCLFHHGDERNYHWYWDDYHRNRMIATGIFGNGDREMMDKYAWALGNNKANDHIRKLADQAWQHGEEHREYFLKHNMYKLDIQKFAEIWQNKTIKDIVGG